MTPEEIKRIKELSKSKIMKQVSLEDTIKKAMEADALIPTKPKRKTLTKEEKDLLELERMLNYDNLEKEEILEPIQEEEKEWDVTINDKIEYFDPALSYELTGYRPITKELGLDFNPKLFTEAADRYRKNGKYTNYIPGTFIHRNYWLLEFKKCLNGYKIGRYRLTGQHYFFLNYYRLLSVLSDKEGPGKRKEDFPVFIAKQYEYFHYLEMCLILGNDGLAFKSRGVGASEIAASNCVWFYTFIQESHCIITAFTEDYVTTTLAKVWLELDFLNTCTEGGFRRVRMKVDTNMVKRASKVDKDGNETGWKSEIEGITSDKPRKLRGNRSDAVFFEEAGSHAELINTYLEGRALVDILGKRVGSRFVFGTASGESNPKLGGLKTMFYNPQTYQILPYKNSYNRKNEVCFTGYFIPSYTMWFGDEEGIGFDERGVVDEERAKKHYLSIWEKMTDPSALIKDKAEYCFTPEDAFIMEGSLAFNMEKLSEQQLNIELGLVPKPKNARLLWPISKETGKVDMHAMPKIEYVERGKILILEEPLKDPDGVAYKNLYCAAVDSIDTSVDTTTGLTDLSNFCIIIYKRLFGLDDPKPVALYKYRPNLVTDAYNEAIKLCLYYNCKVLVEATRVGIIEYFKKNNLTAYLMIKPSSITSGRNKRLYGIPADVKTIERQLQLINDYVENYYTLICFPEMIDELLRYSYENKRKFDIVAAFGIVLVADEEMTNQRPMALYVKANLELSRLGYYKNMYGLIEFGVIPEKQEINYGWLSTYGRQRFGS